MESSTTSPPPPYGEKEMLALTLAPKVTALLSIIGATYILVDVMRDRISFLFCRRLIVGHHRRTTYQRLISGLSMCDIFFAGALFASTWPAPTDTPYVWQAMGNTQSCTAQGVFFHLGGTAVLYNASLSTYYVFSIRNGWSKSKIESVEPWLHVGPILFSVATMIASLALGLFNSSGTVCRIASLPKGCQESWQGDGGTTCERGDNATLYNLLFNLIAKWVSIIIVTINMVLVYLSVRKRERTSRRWSMFAADASTARMTTQIAQQSYLFVGALYLTNFLEVVIKVDILSQDKVPFWIMLTSSILLPSQGFWNAVVYLRPRYLSIRRAQRLSSLRRASVETQRAAQNPVLHALSRELAAVSEAVRNGDLEVSSSREESCNDKPDIGATNAISEESDIETGSQEDKVEGDEGETSSDKHRGSQSRAISEKSDVETSTRNDKAEDGEGEGEGEGEILSHTVKKRDSHNMENETAPAGQGCVMCLSCVSV